MQIGEYPQWAREHLGVDFEASAVRRRYELNSQTVLSQIQDHAFASGLLAALQSCSESYSKNHVKLLMHAGLLNQGPAWSSKSYDSVVDKTFRINVVRNRKFPDAPPDGWCTDDTLYHKIDDIVRTTIVARYLSGADAVVAAVVGHAAVLGVPVRSYRRDAGGYYATHIYAKFPVTLTDSKFEPYLGEVEAEIQVTTQLQDALYDLTHRLYEVRRVSSERDDGSWKWDTNSPRFKAAYAGHALHLLEGIFEEMVEAERNREVEE